MDHNGLRSRLEPLVAELTALVNNTSASHHAGEAHARDLAIERLAEEALEWIMEARSQTNGFAQRLRTDAADSLSAPPHEDVARAE